MTQPQTRMDTGLLPWIVIPVVVGSSPISHPNEINDLAHFTVGFFISQALKFPTVGNGA